MTDEPEKKRKAVVDGTLIYTSVSQMQKADEASGGCLRQWWYRYPFGLPDKPAGKGAKRGKEGHKRIETYLKTGLNVLAPLEREGLPFMPQPGVPSFLVEHPTEDPAFTALDVPIVGFVDLVETGRITDWKFKAKNTLERWPTTKEDLVDPMKNAGIQMLSYGAWYDVQARIAGALPWVELLTLRHVTFQTEGPRRAFETAISIEPERATEGWRTVSERVIPLMKNAAKAPTAHDVKPNLHACDRMGGCPYKATCLDPMARIKAGFIQANKQKVDQMGMLSSMIGNKGVVAPHGVASPMGNPATAAPAPAPKPLIQDQAPASQIAASACAQGQQYKVNGVDATFLALTSFGTQQFASFAPLGGGTPMLVPPTTMVGAFVPPPPTPAPVIQAAPVPAPVPAIQVALPAPAPAPLIQAAPAPAPASPAPEAPKKRGRPAKAAAPTAAPSADGGGVFIYSGCAPLGVQTTDLGDYVDQLQEAIYKSIKQQDPTWRPTYTEELSPANPSPASDLRLAEGNLIGFGKWKAFLASIVEDLLPAPGHYHALRGDERIDVVVNALAKVLEPGHVVVG